PAAARDQPTWGLEVTQQPRFGAGNGSHSTMASSAGQEEAAADGVLEGRFRILRLHDKGGLGEVYVAKDLELNREVALKKLQPRHAGNLDNRMRFLLEGEITGALEHPGIVPVYGMGTYADGRPYYAMRFIRGVSLKAEIVRFHAADRD